MEAVRFLESPLWEVPLYCYLEGGKVLHDSAFSYEMIIIILMQVFYKMVELLVNKYKSNSDAQTTMPCQRRRTRRRDSIQLHDDAHAINSPMTSTARDNTQPQNNTQPHVQVDDERRPRARCHC